MTERVLLVDDEPNLLQSMKRSFRGRFDLVLATGGQAALAELTGPEPFAVVVSDMQMPQVNGLMVLQEFRKSAPNTTRIMLTGNVDQQTAVDAVNSGEIFRFLNKPCSVDVLGEAIDEGIHQFQIVQAEKKLLSETVLGAVSLVTEMMALTNPAAHSRGTRLGHLARRLAIAEGLVDPWQFEVAAMLSQIGITTLDSNESAATAASREFDALTSSQLVGRIPRLEMVAQIIRLQYCQQLPADLDPMVAIGARVLGLLNEYDSFRAQSTVAKSFQQLRGLSNVDIRLLDSLETILLSETTTRIVSPMELKMGMVLEGDLNSLKGTPLLRAGSELTANLIDRIQKIHRESRGIPDGIEVRIID